MRHQHGHQHPSCIICIPSLQVNTRAQQGPKCCDFRQFVRIGLKVVAVSNPSLVPLAAAHPLGGCQGVTYPDLCVRMLTRLRPSIWPMTVRTVLEVHNASSARQRCRAPPRAPTTSKIYPSGGRDESDDSAKAGSEGMKATPAVCIDRKSICIQLNMKTSRPVLKSLFIRSFVSKPAQRQRAGEDRENMPLSNSLVPNQITIRKRVSRSVEKGRGIKGKGKKEH